MANNTGGQAFPRAGYGTAGSGSSSEGMTLRDYFAAKAMQASLSACAGTDFASNMRRCSADEGISIGEKLARDAYTVADAMLAECSK